MGRNVGNTSILSKKGTGRASSITSVCGSGAFTPNSLGFSSPLLTASAFLIANSKNAYCDAVSGLSAVCQANTKSSAVTGLPSLHLAFLRSQKVAWVGVTSQRFATAPSKRSSSPMRTNPSITWPSTMPEIESVARLLFSWGGSSRMMMETLLFSTSMPLTSRLVPLKAVPA